MKILSFFFGFLFFHGTISAQFNIKIGYTADFSAYTVSNDILNEFNGANQWLEKEFKNLRFTQGLQLGFRYRVNAIALDGNWERTKRSREASGINLEQEQFISDLEFTFDRFGLGLEVYGKYFGVGANIYYQSAKVKEVSGGRDSKIKITDHSNFGNKLYLMLSASGSETMALSLQPYLLIPWSGNNLNALDAYLKANGTGSIYPLQKNLHFGISLIFYNGPQNN